LALPTLAQTVQDYVQKDTSQLSQVALTSSVGSIEVCDTNDLVHELKVSLVNKIGFIKERGSSLEN
jgi:hypothetical protein